MFFDIDAVSEIFTELEEFDVSLRAFQLNIAHSQAIFESCYSTQFSKIMKWSSSDSDIIFTW